MSLARYRKTPRRAALVKEIRAALDRIIANEDGMGLRAMQESIGWLSNFRDHTWSDFRIALGALVPLLPMRSLRSVRATAKYHAEHPPAVRAPAGRAA